MSEPKICSVEGCETPPVAREMCDKHYRRDKYLPDKECFVTSCSNKCTSKYWCAHHYTEDEKLRKNHQRRCRSCEVIYPLDIYVRPNGNLYGVCVACYKNVTNERWAQNIEKNRHIKLKGQFGISLDTYNRMLIEQGSVCALCQRPEIAKDHRSGSVRALAVHHNHRTGKILALCCGRCNRFMGQFNDDPEVFKRAVQICEGTFYENS